MAGHVDKVIPVTNDPVEVVLLPQDAGGLCLLLNLQSGKSFPTRYDSCQRLRLIKGQKQLDMIRYDYPSMQKIATLIEMAEGPRHDIGASGVVR